MSGLAHDDGFDSGLSARPGLQHLQGVSSVCEASLGVCLWPGAHFALLPEKKCDVNVLPISAALVMLRASEPSMSWTCVSVTGRFSRPGRCEQ